MSSPLDTPTKNVEGMPNRRSVSMSSATWCMVGFIKAAQRRAARLKGICPVTAYRRFFASHLGIKASLNQCSRKATWSTSWETIIFIGNRPHSDTWRAGGLGRHELKECGFRRAKVPILWLRRTAQAPERNLNRSISNSALAFGYNRAIVPRSGRAIRSNCPSGGR
jgi:hypothetical protein